MPQPTDPPAPDPRARLIAIGAEFHARGWSLATSGNYSAVVARDPLRLLVTASGKDKSSLGPSDFVVVDATGFAWYLDAPLDSSDLDSPRAEPSAETLLHLELARDSDVGAILHTHSVWSTLLSDRYLSDGGFVIEGFEMLKGLRGVTTHEHAEWVEVLPNSQDIRALAAELRRRLDARSSVRAANESSGRADSSDRSIDHGFLLGGHGLYTWGRDVEEARRHVEAFEFLFEVLVRRQTLGLRTGGSGAPASGK